MGGDATRAVGPGEHTEIVHSELLQEVELPGEALTPLGGGSK